MGRLLLLRSICQEKPGRPFCGAGLFWAAGPAGPVLAPSLSGPQWTGPPLGGSITLPQASSLSDAPGREPAPVC